MQYEIATHHEIGAASDDPRGQQPGHYVVAYTDDGGEGRVVAGPFTDERDAQARADLLSIDHHDTIAGFVEQFTRGPEEWSRLAMQRAMRGTNLTDVEVELVISEVLAGYDAVATFVAGQAAGRGPLYRAIKNIHDARVGQIIAELEAEKESS